MAAVAMSYRATATSNLTLSPYEILYGRPMSLPIDYSLLSDDPTVPSVESYAADIKVKLGIYSQIAMQNAKDSALKHSRAHNAKAVEPSFKAGDKVLLFDPTTRKHEAGKLTTRWTGPYFILECMPGWNYKLKHISKGTELRRPVHASRLRPLREMDNDYRLLGSNTDVLLYETKTPKRGSILRVKVGDITKTQCQVIVNPRHASGKSITGYVTQAVA